MRKKKVWRYYCDFCGKGGCGSGAMKHHEKHCTLNPQRICRMCQVIGESQQGMDFLVANYDKGGIETLRSAANECPNCMLAAIRIWKKTSGKSKEETWDDWNYKKELESFWSEQNAERRERELSQEWAEPANYR
jgi:hypothetical protein